ncbi:MAG: hypothetical protein KDA96_04070 [Planctomycetaceae bacterium]|nr:hypothetical protein [Planctomycetaceae bacterium]
MKSCIRFAFVIVVFFPDIAGKSTGLRHTFSQDVQVSAVDVVPKAVRCEYCITLHSPGGQRTETAILTYVVTRDRWVMEITGFSPYWTFPRLTPIANGVRFLSTPEESQIWFDGDEVPESVSTADTASLEKYSKPSFRLLHLADRTRSFWSLPKGTVSLVESGSTEYQHKYLGLEPHFELRIDKTDNGEINIEQRLPDFFKVRAVRENRLQSRESQTGPRFLPVETFYARTNGRFLKWNSEFTLPADQRTPVLPEGFRQANDLSGAYGAGGRTATLKWQEVDGVAIPQEIEVHLGPTRDGMFLRSMRCLSAEVIPAETADALIDKMASKDWPRPAVAALFKDAPARFWGESVDIKSEPELGQRVDQFVKTLESSLREERPVGYRMAVLRELCLVAVSTDRSNGHIQLRRYLDAYLQQLSEITVPQAQLSAVFSLIDMLHSWERPELQQVAWEVLRERMSAIPVTTRIPALIGTQQGNDAYDLHALLLMDAVADGQTERIDPVLIHSALVRGLELQQLQVANFDTLTHLPDPVPDDLNVARRMREVLLQLTESDDITLREVAQNVLSKLN